MNYLQGVLLFVAPGDSLQLTTHFRSCRVKVRRYPVEYADGLLLSYTQ